MPFHPLFVLREFTQETIPENEILCICNQPYSPNHIIEQVGSTFNWIVSPRYLKLEHQETESVY